MAKFLDIAIETAEASLSSLGNFVQHNALNYKPYEIKANILVHAFFCLTISFAVWQFFSATDKIFFEKFELAVNVVIVLTGWLFGAFLFHTVLRLFSQKSRLLDILKLYVFVHANVILIGTILVLVYFVFAGGSSLESVSLFDSTTTSTGFDGVYQIFLETRNSVEVQKIQLAFLIVGVILLLFFQPAHFHAQTGAPWLLNVAATVALTLASALTQLYLWQVAVESSEVVGRVLSSPGLVPP